MKACNPFLAIWQKLQRALVSPLETLSCFYLGPESDAAEVCVEPQINADLL